MNRWTLDCFDPSHIGQVDLQAMEDNLESLRTHFQDDDDDEPTDPVPGMFRFRSVDGVLYVRNADNDEWYGFLDLTTGFLHGDMFPDDIVTEGKIVAGAVTAGKIGTGAVSAEKIAAGAVTAEKIANGSITLAKNANVTAGDYSFLEDRTSRTFSLYYASGFVKMKEIKVDRGGTIRAHYTITVAAEYTFQHAIYKNGVLAGTLRTKTGAAGTFTYYDDIACAVGDLIQAYIVNYTGGLASVTCDDLRLCCAEFGVNRNY